LLAGIVTKRLPVKESEAAALSEASECQQVVNVDGLSSPIVVGIAFAAFFIGISLTGAIWYIHTCTGKHSYNIYRPVVIKMDTLQVYNEFYLAIKTLVQLHCILCHAKVVLYLTQKAVLRNMV